METNFKCSDGTCVSMSVFCDFKQDCLDNSDESDCGKKMFLLYDVSNTVPTNNTFEMFFNIGNIMALRNKLENMFR